MMNLIKNSILNSVKSAMNHNWPNVYFSTFTQPLLISTTQTLMGTPLKKKKKVDPAQVRIKDERKRRKLWKECRRLMRLEKQLKPLDEIDIPYVLIDEREARLREKPIFTSEVLDRRVDLRNEWSRYRKARVKADFDMIDKLYAAQERALKHLKITSPRLYDEAIKIDESLLPITLNGVTSTPPIKNYDSPDGDYIDITRKWDPPKIPNAEQLNKKKK